MNNVATNLLKFQGDSQILEQIRTSPHQLEAVPELSEKAIIRDVYLSDLHQIQQIYLINLSKEKFSERTEKIGLPLALSSIGKEVTGYASVVYNENHQAEINFFFKQGFESEEIKEQLFDRARTEMNSMLGKGLKPENAVTRFTNWLNKTI